jgi:hypothetical protein
LENYYSEIKSRNDYARRGRLAKFVNFWMNPSVDDDNINNKCDILPRRRGLVISSPPATEETGVYGLWDRIPPG